MSCEHKYLTAACTHCEFLLLATIRSQHQHELGLQGVGGQARFLEYNLHLLDSSCTQARSNCASQISFYSLLLKNAYFCIHCKIRLNTNFSQKNVYSFLVIAQEMFGERDMGNGTASAVTKTCRKSGQFIFPNDWLHIPTEKKKIYPS